MLHVQAGFTYEVAQPTDALIQVEVANTPEQELSETRLVTNALGTNPVAAESDVGIRRWVRAERYVELEYATNVCVTRTTGDLLNLESDPATSLSGDVTRYILPSRYCDPDQFETFAQREFAGLKGGPRAIAVAEWIKTAVEYVPGSSDSRSTAKDTFVKRQGICRDFAHLFVTLMRASGVPARFVSCYALDASPPDFHAAAEVWLAGAWHLIDPSGMAKPNQTAIIGVGRDAADVAFLTTLGPARFVEQFVKVTSR